MKKLLLSLAIAVVSFSFGQITLEHSFSKDEYITTYSKDETIFVSFIRFDNKLQIYNSDYSLRKTVNITLPANYNQIWVGDVNSYHISKHIFNTDDKYEFLVTLSSQTDGYYDKLILINEDGQLIKDFNPNSQTLGYRGYSEIFHDVDSNKNKIVIDNMMIDGSEQFDVYSLPTSELTTKEIESKKRLSAFPIPTNKTLNIFNPGNGTNKVEVYDVSGKNVISKSFNINDSRITIDVENLPKGTYVYKIGNVSSKFIKN